MLKSILIACTFICYLSYAEDLKYKDEIRNLEVLSGVVNFDSKYDLIIIDFWASWCDPCKESFPYYEKMIGKSKKKILMLTVSLDRDKKNSLEFLKSQSSLMPALWDQDKKWMKLLDFDSIPHLIVLNENWKLIQTLKGFNAKTRAMFPKIIDEK